MEILNKSTNVSHCPIVNNQQLQMYEKSRDESNADTDLSKQMLLDIGVILRINMCFYLLRKFLYKPLQKSASDSGSSPAVSLPETDHPIREVSQPLTLFALLLSYPDSTVSSL